MKNFIKNELSGWKSWEVVWFSASCIIIAGLSVYWHDDIMGIISAVTGIAYVVCTGKGKLSAYIFGLVNCVLYAVISYKAKLYGETMLNALYYLPMMAVGFIVWRKNIDSETNEVAKKHMSWSKRGILLLIIALCTLLYGLILKKLNDAMPFVDSFTTVSSVIAMIISVRMFSEQWWIWAAVDAFSVYMWWRNFASGNDNMATLLMWIIYLANAFVMLIKWEREAVRNERKKVTIHEKITPNEV